MQGKTEERTPITVLVVVIILTILILVLCVIGTSKEQKTNFHYGENVSITDGFYKGQSGHVVQYSYYNEDLYYISEELKDEFPTNFHDRDELYDHYDQKIMECFYYEMKKR